MLKNLIRFEQVVEGKAIHLLVEADSQISHIKDALCSFMGHCVNVENSAKAQQSVAQPAAPVVAEAPAPVPQPVEESNGIQE